MKEALSATDLASLLSVTTRTLRNWAEDGSGPKRELRDLEPVYPLVDLVPWLKMRYPRLKLGTIPKLLTAQARKSLLEAWERRLCARYGLRSTADLYLAVRQADFHNAGQDPDPIEWWRPAAYAVFSGELPKHKLRPERLRDLLRDFESHSDAELARKKKFTAAEFAEEIGQALTEDAFDSIENDRADLRRSRNYVASAYKYQCASCDRYDFPPSDPYIAGRMSPTEQDFAFGPNGYLAFVMEKGNPVGRLARLACERNLDDLLKSRAASAG
jgi:hypothetical protein